MLTKPRMSVIKPRSSMEIIYQSPWNLMCSVCPIPSTYIGMPSPAWGPAVLYWGDDVASLPPQTLTQQCGPLIGLASDLGRACKKYNCTVQFLSSLFEVQTNWSWMLSILNSDGRNIDLRKYAMSYTEFLWRTKDPTQSESGDSVKVSQIP